MTSPRSSPAQGAPPAELVGFPTATALGESWWREHGDRPERVDHGCWWFSGHEPGEEPRGRFDLTEPNGTCYLGETVGVAVRERCGRFLSARLPIPQGHLDGRLVTPVAIPSTRGPVADLTDPDAAWYGVTGELSSGNDYAVSGAWAEALRGSGHDGGIYYLPRFTPGQEYALALFGAAGPRDWGIGGEPVPLIDALADIGYDPARSSIPSISAAATDDAVEPEDAS